MSAVRDGGHDKPRTRLMMMLGHYADPLIVVLGVLLLVWNALGRPRYLNDPAIVVTAFLALLVYSDWYVHPKRLCERCAAATPLNPQAEVDRRRSYLRFWHWRGRSLIAIGVCVLAIAANSYGAFAYSRQPAWSLATACAAYALFIPMTLPSWFHHRLYPWCPWCSWPDEGDEEAAPEVPDPAMSR